MDEGHWGESSTRWEPERYLRFSQPRLRPALDLIARLPEAPLRRVFDLGCGTGQITARLARRYPDARVVGVDSSREMLAKARALPASRVAAWQGADLRTWSPGEPADLLFSNAALHWLPRHEELMPRLLSFLSPGGTLAVQMPLSWYAPFSHLLRDLLAGEGGEAFGDAALRERIGRAPVHQPSDYFELLQPIADAVDIWRTEYLHVLDGDDPVFEWVRSTTLRPVLEGLDDADGERFAELYRRRLRELYPRRADRRTLLPFPRIFIVAKARKDAGTPVDPIES